MDKSATVESTPAAGAAPAPAGPTATRPTGGRKRPPPAKAGLRAANALLGFVLEAALLAALVYWGLAQPNPWNLVLAIGLPAVTVVLWGVFLAPRSERRLVPAAVRWLALLAFLAGAAALAAAGAMGFAVLLAAFAAVNFALAWFTDR